MLTLGMIVHISAYIHVPWEIHVSLGSEPSKYVCSSQLYTPSISQGHASNGSVERDSIQTAGSNAYV